jgi:hypothetical protein
MALEPFELHLAGGAVEAGYRRMRPEVEAMPWGSIRLDEHDPEVVLAARRTWTLAAFQEHRTGAACAETLNALITARAPLDLVAQATRYPLDEMVHVELCARLANELGGAVQIVHDPDVLIRRPERDLSPRLRAAELVVRNFCVGEAVSIPILRASCKAASDPLVRAVLGRIVKDEAAHGRFGWLYLDWLAGSLSADERRHLAAAASHEITLLERNWAKQVTTDPARTLPGTLGWMEPATYLAIAARALEDAVRRPLRERGLLSTVATVTT